MRFGWIDQKNNYKTKRKNYLIEYLNLTNQELQTKKISTRRTVNKAEYYFFYTSIVTLRIERKLFATPVMLHIFYKKQVNKISLLLK